MIQMANIAHSSAIDREESIPAEDRDRLKSVLAIWGDGSAFELEKGGELFIGGVNRAFLADIGLGSYRGIGSAKREPSKEVPSVSDTYDLEPVSSSQKNITQRKPPVDQAARMYQRWKEDIDHWFSRKEPLKYHPDYRKEIRDFLIGTGQMAGAINWQDIGVPAYIASERLSNQSCICIEGQGDEPAKDKVLLSLDRSPESRDAILALMERRYAGSWDFEYSAYYQQRLITWLERVKPSLIRNVLGPIEEQKPCVLQWCLTLQYIQALLYRNHIPDENPMELIRALFQPYENHSAAVSSTNEWSDMAVFLSNSSAQLDAARTLLRQSALTIMGAPQLAKDEKAKKVYRTRELVDATEGLISSHWDLEDSLPQSNPGNMMYNPADLLKKIYPRIHKVLHAELTQFHSAAEQLVELVGEISEESLIDALSAVNEFLLECSASKLFVPEKLRLAFDIAPIERARTIFASYQNLKKADTAHFMDQLKIYSEKALVDLLEFARNLSDIDTLAKQYEREACQELLKITQGVDLSALGVLAQSKLADLAAQLEKLEVQDAD